MGSTEKSFDIPASFEHYRGHMEDSGSRHLSMEYEGMGELEFMQALQDPRSAVMPLVDRPEIGVPLAVPMEYLPWYNQIYFRNLTPGESQLYVYSNRPDLLSSSPETYIQTMAPIVGGVAESNGLLVCDHSHQDKPVIDRDLNFIAASLGAKSKDQLAKSDPPARHYMYARQLLRRDRQPARHQATDLSEVYVYARGEGVWKNERAELATSIDPAEAEQVWGYYDKAFAEHNTVDPILASFSHEQFLEIMGDSRFYKFVCRESESISNLLIIADVGLCPWMNQSYYRQHFPDAYEAGNIFYSPGVISDPESNDLAKSLSTMGLLIKLFCQARIEPVITFVCDEVSNSQVPKLTEHAVNRTGVLTTDITYPDAFHLVRAFSFVKTNART